VYICVHASIFSWLVYTFDWLWSFCLVKFITYLHPYDPVCHDTTRHDITTTLQNGMWFFITLGFLVFFFLEQHIIQQMVWFQNSISKCLHHHIFFNMFFYRISMIHCVQILLHSNLGPIIWFIIQQVVITFWLSSLIFFTTFWTWFRLSYPSIGVIL